MSKLLGLATAVAVLLSPIYAYAALSAPTGPSAIPYPVTTHPRLWLTPADVNKYKTWAVSSNPIYQTGLLPLIQQCDYMYNTYFFPKGVAANPYPDPGDTQGYGVILNEGSSNTEDIGVILAFASLIDPSAANRIKYAQEARNLIMYAMNLAALGPQSSTPFRDPMFAVYNRANASGMEWPLIVDWIYNNVDGSGHPILTATDKATVRKVFLLWANECLNASTTGGDHPVPIGVMNSVQLLPDNLPYRMASNNYYLGHARLLTMMGLAIDPSDDPAVNPAQPVTQIGNTIRSYILDANGAWLYQLYAMMGEAPTVVGDYKVPGNATGAGFGLASGGLPPEGMLYGHSFGFILGQLLALQTAGFNNISLSGPQIKLIGAPVWDRYVKGYLSSLVPSPQLLPGMAYMGPVYEYSSYGDLLRLWVTPEVMNSFTLLTLLEGENGSTAHQSAARWLAVDGSEGGSADLMSRITSPWSYGAIDAIMYFLLLDPAATAAPDPRSTFPTTFYDPPAGRILAHSDWSANGTMFTYRASWTSINHQNDNGGQFELFRKGEWLTKEMSNYDNNDLGLTSTYHNAITIHNWSAGTPDLQWYEAGEWANGSQWMLGLSQGDPTTVMSTGPGYIYAASNLTKLYNRPDIYTPANSADNVGLATRDILWLNGDYVVVYDRAVTSHTGLFKRFNLCLVTNPTVSGATSTETLASGQKLYIQTLLPSTPTITSYNGAQNLNPVAAGEPTQFILQVEDATNPVNERFLHVLQGADKTTAMAPATHVASTAGALFDGAAFGTTAVYFPVNSGEAVPTTTLHAPPTANTMIVAGLVPGATYKVSITSVTGGLSVTVAPSTTGLAADSAGLLKAVTVTLHPN